MHMHINLHMHMPMHEHVHVRTRVKAHPRVHMHKYFAHREFNLHRKVVSSQNPMNTTPHPNHLASHRERIL